MNSYDNKTHPLSRRRLARCTGRANLARRFFAWFPIIQIKASETLLDKAVS
jgi:hypothetical protein